MARAERSGCGPIAAGTISSGCRSRSSTWRRTARSASGTTTRRTTASCPRFPTISIEATPSPRPIRSAPGSLPRSSARTCLPISGRTRHRWPDQHICYPVNAVPSREPTSASPPCGSGRARRQAVASRSRHAAARSRSTSAAPSVARRSGAWSASPTPRSAAAGGAGAVGWCPSPQPALGAAHPPPTRRTTRAAPADGCSGRAACRPRARRRQ